MGQAWEVYRGHEIERVQPNRFEVRRNRAEVLHIANSVAEARAWIDGMRERDFTRSARAAKKLRR